MLGKIVSGVANTVGGAVGDTVGGVVGNLDLDAETLGRVAIAAITGDPMLIAQAAGDVVDGDSDEIYNALSQAMGGYQLLGGDPLAYASDYGYQRLRA